MIEITTLRSQLPKKIERLADIAYDMWWSSSHEARSLFRMISRHHWRIGEHNPITLLQDVQRERLDELALNEEFLRAYHSTLAHYDIECERSTKWFDSEVMASGSPVIAYFSAEYGIHSSLPIYSGGLGILSGDHIKAADDLGVPLVAVGFMYPYGYFEQHISETGEQLASYRHLDTTKTVLQQVFHSDGSPLIIQLHLGNEASILHLRIWRVNVGTVTIYLMDSDLDENSPDDREITRRLYGGDKLYRLRQEIALGVGGVRTLETLGIKPTAWHANEGHSSFMFIERLRSEMKNGNSFQDAIEHIRKTSIFTTHTIVPAGHDTFDPNIVAEYFHETISDLGITREEFLSLGLHQEEWTELFNMTALAMTMTDRRNAVSLKHQQLTREMWHEYDVPERTIGNITNGVHVATWLAPELEELFTLTLTSEWRSHRSDPDFWQNVHSIPDHLIWHVRREMKLHLGRYIGDELARHEPESAKDLIIRGALFDPTVLTVGFARRFATYKRATLLFRDPERLARLLNNSERPMQFIFSGKAHPADDGGKSFIKQLWSLGSDPLFRGRIFFLEDYSMHSAKFLVQGSDVWLNTPRAPLEASGTSGMKAAINGVPNLSVADGWWLEGYNGKNGWSITSNEHLSEEEQDAADAEQLYTLLEQEIIPLYYDRDLHNIPLRWLSVVKESIASVLPRFSSERMVREYVEKLYLPAMGKK